MNTQRKIDVVYLKDSKAFLYIINDSRNSEASVENSLNNPGWASKKYTIDNKKYEIIEKYTVSNCYDPNFKNIYSDLKQTVDIVNKTLNTKYNWDSDEARRIIWRLANRSILHHLNIEKTVSMK